MERCERRPGTKDRDTAGARPSLASKWLESQTES
jgi:hypothetical protein